MLLISRPRAGRARRRPPRRRGRCRRRDGARPPPRRQTRDVTVDVLDTKLDALRSELRRLERVVVAFSGGADSAFLAAFATKTLGSGAALAVTAVSPSLAAGELDDCRRLSTEWGLRWQPVTTDELERAAYRLNDPDRCFHCKSALMDVLAPVAAEDGATVVLGVNTDDLTDHRPGQRAAAEAGAEFPLVAAGFSKQDVRDASRRLGLRTWDKPAAACLASRIPTGTPVTIELLSTVDRAEAGAARPRFRSTASASPWRDGAHRGRCRPARSRRRQARRHRRRPARPRLPLRHARPRGIPLRQHPRTRAHH